jgi:urease accessory protein
MQASPVLGFPGEPCAVPQGPAGGWTGLLRLRIENRAGRSYAAHQYHEGALRVLRPHYLDHSGQVAYTVINPGGAYLGADHYLIDLHVLDGGSILITTQAATKVYRTPQGPATQTMVVRLGAGATLEYLPDQVIVYRQGSYRQRTVVEMAPTSSLVLAEVITPGWSPTGEAFGYDELRMRTEVRVRSAAGVRRLAVDQLRIVPREGHEVFGLGYLEGHSHTGQMLIADRRIDGQLYDRLAALVEESDTHSGITHAGIPGEDGVVCVSVRSLAQSTKAIADLHHRIVDLLRTTWRGQAPLDLRKY